MNTNTGLEFGTQLSELKAVATAAARKLTGGKAVHYIIDSSFAQAVAFFGMGAEDMPAVVVSEGIYVYIAVVVSEGIYAYIAVVVSEVIYINIHVIHLAHTCV
jgi:hypothetical protein